jgi:Flp pilus assembly protein TadG
LIAAIALAILYFGLMELMLIESQRALREAQRFRSKIIATTLAENAADLAAEQLCTSFAATVDYANAEGTMTGTMTRNPPPSDYPKKSDFVIDVTGVSSGVAPATAKVKLDGEVDQESASSPPQVHIKYAYHSQ